MQTGRTNPLGPPSFPSLPAARRQTVSFNAAPQRLSPRAASGVLPVTGGMPYLFGGSREGARRGRTNVPPAGWVLGVCVSELSAVKASGGRAGWISWPHSLSWSLVMIFAIGAPSLIITRYIYWQMRPEVFLRNPPSISGTASRPPSSDFFMWSMFAVTVCICIAWLLNLRMNMDRLNLAGSPSQLRGPASLNAAACLFGLVAATFLVLLSVYPLTSGRDMHMMASWGFYVCEVFALILDYSFSVWFSRIAPQQIGPIERRGIRLRGIAGAGVLVSSLFFVYLFLNYDDALPLDHYTKQLIYVGTEYLLSFCFFAYPMAGFLEMRRHYREVAPRLRSA
ncbi:MAG: Frag1/DRAM/Sfk1 family [Pseudomonadota bacterium]